MECTKGDFYYIIPKVLKEKPLSGKKLFKESNEHIYKNKGKYSQKSSFMEALLCLMENKIVQVDEYKMALDERKRKQAFNSDGFIFSLVKTEPSEILTLFQELGDSNTYKAAEKKLFGLFKRKIEEIDSYNLKMWEKLKREVEVREPTDEELLWFIASEEADEFMKTNQGKYDIDDLTLYFERIRENMERFKDKISSENKNYNLYLLMGHPKHVDMDDPRPRLLINPHIITTERIDIEEFLDKIHYVPLNILPDKEVNLLFQMDFLLYIKSQPEKEKNKLIKKAIIALSDQENSKECLHELINESTEKKVKLIKNY